MVVVRAVLVFLIDGDVEVGDGEGGLVAFFTGDGLFTTCECGSAGNQAEGEENVLHGHDLEARK